MAPVAPAAGPSIYTPATKLDRAENFEAYWAYLRQKNGELFEAERAVAEKQRILARFREQPVDPRTLDRATAGGCWQPWITQSVIQPRQQGCREREAECPGGPEGAHLSRSPSTEPG